MLREAMLVLPKRDNAGRDLSALREALASDLVAAFGGVTARDATGYWKDGDMLYREPVTELVSACVVGPKCDRVLRELADKIARLAQQVAVYVRYASGRVEVIQTKGADHAQENLASDRESLARPGRAASQVL